MPVELPEWAHRSFVDPLIPSLQVGSATGQFGMASTAANTDINQELQELRSEQCMASSSRHIL